MSDIKIGIKLMQEPSKNIGEILIDFYENMIELEKDMQRSGKQAALIVMTINDVKDVIKVG